MGATQVLHNYFFWKFDTLPPGNINNIGPHHHGAYLYIPLTHCVMYCFVS